MPKDIQKVIDEEIESFKNTNKENTQWNITKTYLDWLTQMPYGVVSKDNYDIK